MVREEDRVTAFLARDAGEEIVPGFARRRFDRETACFGESGDVDMFDGAAQAELFREPLDERRVGTARASAQSMIEMAEDEFAITQRAEQVQQRDRIASTGNAKEVATVGRI